MCMYIFDCRLRWDGISVLPPFAGIDMGFFLCFPTIYGFFTHGWISIGGVSGGFRVEDTYRPASFSLWRNSRLVHMEGMDGWYMKASASSCERGYTLAVYTFFSIYPFSSGSTDGLNTDVLVR